MVFLATRIMGTPSDKLFMVIDYHKIKKMSDRPNGFSLFF